MQLIRERFSSQLAELLRTGLWPEWVEFVRLSRSPLKKGKQNKKQVMIHQTFPNNSRIPEKPHQKVEVGSLTCAVSWVCAAHGRMHLVVICSSDKVKAAWQRGTVLAEGQNLARRLMETPSNKMTPTVFCEEVSKQLEHTCTIISRWVWRESSNFNIPVMPWASLSSSSSSIP